MVSLTLKESFKDAFMTGNMVTVDFSGIPMGATLAAMVTSNPVDSDLTETHGRLMTSTMDDSLRYGGCSKGWIRHGDVGWHGRYRGSDNNRPAPTSVTLGLTLTAIPPDPDADMLFPLDRGSVMAKASFTDASGEDDNFEDAFTDYVTVFNIRPAQCELLFPVVTVLPATTGRGNWETAISVTNPAYEDEMASGGLTFTFYGMENVEATYDTTVDTIAGVGLETDGTLSPGGTYQVLASEILGATGWGETFQGHVHLRADYTNCSGLGWVTDWVTVNQAYTATVIDADTGTDPE